MFALFAPYHPKQDNSFIHAIFNNLSAKSSQPSFVPECSGGYLPQGWKRQRSWTNA